MRAQLDGTLVVDYTLTGQPVVHGTALPLPILSGPSAPVKVQVAQAFRTQSAAAAEMWRRRRG